MRARAGRAPDRGDVVVIALDRQRGHEASGRRPALVVSPLAYNKLVGLALLCPITNQAKGYPFEVPVPEGGKVTGVVLADLVKSLDWRARGATRVERLPDDVVEQVTARLRALLV